MCSGNWVAGQIADSVTIPSTLPAGDYVVGWRYDCEETDQVWSNCAGTALPKCVLKCVLTFGVCADVTITK